MSNHPSASLFFRSLLPLLLLTACSPSLPKEYDDVAAQPPIYPDYVGVTIPSNIAPLTFQLDEEAERMVARYSAGDCQIVCARKMKPTLRAWRQLIAASLSSGSSQIQVDVFAQHSRRWTHYSPFSITVSPDSIDPWLSFRLIAPSYVTYEALTISQRCLENYSESVIYDNMLCGREVEGQCINCHNYQQHNPQRMQFHARQHHGGTVIAYDGELKKVNMSNDSIISAGVYPAWHPWMKLIVYSTNHTSQNFLTTSRDKIEVFDSESDLIAYDIDSDEVTNIESRSDELEVFPAWAPDGRTLYYCSAHFVRNPSIENSHVDIMARYDSIRYNIYCKSFDPSTKQFGPRRAVLIADSLMPRGASALLPRISPDGRYMLFSMAHHGVFHIWHHDADLWMMDLQTQEIRRLDEVNSPDTESYHSWSGNGKWIVFSSRRDDGMFTRPFFAHIDGSGHFSKPFELPCANPDFHRQFMKNYNIPELMSGPVTYRPHDFARLLKGEGKPVKYVRQLSN